MPGPARSVWFFHVAEHVQRSPLSLGRSDAFLLPIQDLTLPARCGVLNPIPQSRNLDRWNRILESGRSIAFSKWRIIWIAQRPENVAEHVATSSRFSTLPAQVQRSVWSPCPRRLSVPRLAPLLSPIQELLERIRSDVAPFLRGGIGKSAPPMPAIRILRWGAV
jgi:hypothetical protein